MLLSERTLIYHGVKVDRDAIFALLEQLFREGCPWFRQSILYVLFHILQRAPDSTTLGSIVMWQSPKNSLLQITGRWKRPLRNIILLTTWGGPRSSLIIIALAPVPAFCRASCKVLLQQATRN